MKNGFHVVGLASIAILTSTIGCGSKGPAELAPDRFYRAQPPGTNEERHVLVDKPGMMYNDVHMDLMEKNAQDPLHLKEEKPAERSVTSISPPSSELAAMSTTRPVPVVPTTQTARMAVRNSTGGYMTVGAVVTEVNGTPIYADKVIDTLNPVFAAEAKQRDEKSFRAFAENEIKNQVYRLVNDELIYAQAESKLDTQEKELADFLTQRWREQQKTAAGGSIQAARAKFAADGVDFDEALKEKYRQNMTAIYIEKKIRPQVQVTADDIRRYYDKHRDTQFSEADTVTYRLIKISIAKAGSRDEAMKRAQDIVTRAKNGEDFQTLATNNNDDARLARAAGLEPPTQRGALRNEKLNEALFNTPQGQVTPIIEDKDAFYVAKIETVKQGRTRPFEDKDVQDQIRDILAKQQMQPLMERERDKRLANGIMVPNPPLFEPAIEMAMQKYPQWAAK
jgi:parvulin-like peptidyl-prolyl isomerase/predicted small lipoprotein YifL